MSSKINFYFKRDEISPTVKLYSYWGGYYARNDLKEALNHARSRWDDPEYGTRMMISCFLSVDLMGEGYFGISAEKPGYYQAEETGYYIVDFHDKQITFVGPYGDTENFSFENFSSIT